MIPCKRLAIALTILVSVFSYQQRAVAGGFANWLDDTFNGGARQAGEKAIAKDVDNQFAVITACESVVRNRSQNTTTLQFQRGWPLAQRTEGGYVAIVMGSDAQRRYAYRCYTDSGFRVTNMSPM